MSRLLCLDVGNSRCHPAWVEGQEVESLPPFPTRDLVQSGLPETLRELLRESRDSRLAYSSVVPAATKRLNEFSLNWKGESFHLTAESTRGLSIRYPLRHEIGEDRLADAIGGQLLCGAPVLVIDCGSAIVFDIVTPEGGYEGGIIAPGLSLMTRYLHEKTALLPLLDPLELSVKSPFGRSTREAMEIGCLLGAAGLVDRLTQHALKAFLGYAGEVPVLITGGDAGLLRPHLGDAYRWIPHLTLIGLAEAARRYWST